MYTCALGKLSILLTSVQLLSSPNLQCPNINTISAIPFFANLKSFWPYRFPCFLFHNSPTDGLREESGRYTKWRYPGDKKVTFAPKLPRMHPETPVEDWLQGEFLVRAYMKVHSGAAGRHFEDFCYLQFMVTKYELTLSFTLSWTCSALLVMLQTRHTQLF